MIHFYTVCTSRKMTWGAKFGPRILSLTPVSYGLTLCKCCFHKIKGQMLSKDCQRTNVWVSRTIFYPTLCRET